MLHHVSVGVRDVERAAQFYDAVLGALGYKRVMEVLPYGVAYGEDEPVFWIQLPHNQQVATPGNGAHISFIARSQDQVNEFHRLALEEGAQNAGEPGPRPDYTPDYYGAFVFDLDGNKLEATLLPVAEWSELEEVPAKKPARKVAKKSAKKAVKKVKKTAKKSAAKAAPAKKAVKKTAKKAAAKSAPVKPAKDAKKDKKGGKKDKKNKKNKKGKK